MNSTEFDLIYGQNTGFDKTKIFFYEGTPNLTELFYPNEFAPEAEHKAQPVRLFVTDTTISELPSVKHFISLFTSDETSSLNLPAFTAHRGKDVLLVLGAGEEYKTINSVLSIEQVALDYNLDRRCIFTAIGGGVICDMTGFAASLFKRGVKCEFVPTTLLAMVDASIGGKTGCDFKGYKNMIGTFYPAAAVYIWSDFVQSLSQKEYRSGLAEAVKTALLFSKDLYSVFIKERDSITIRKSETLAQIIKACVEAKAAVVQDDFRETSKRALLNFGHTFGHALESVAGLGTISHGDAVAWGMGRALDLGVQLGICNSIYADATKEMLASFEWDMNPIPAVIAPKPTGNQKNDEERRKAVADELIKSMHKDKKNGSTSLIRIITQKSICDNVIQEVSESKILPVLS